MTKSDLKTGMRVTLRNGWTGIVFLGCEFSQKWCQGIKDIYVFDNGSCQYFENINDDLTGKDFKVLDIVKVEIPYNPGSIMHNDDGFSTVWIRQEPKLHTIAEIAKILGYPFKIVETKP